MHIKLKNGMAGILPDGREFVLEPGDIVDYSHDPADARRIVAQGVAEEVGPLRAAEAIAAGRRVYRHPVAAARK
jgi:hypothetical protein